MAGASMKDIKNRIKSIENTMQITKAMELVASSKLRRAKERAETSRPYFEILYDTLCEVLSSIPESDSTDRKKRTVQKSCIILIAGDRGLAGGYNHNVIKLAQEIAGHKDICILPIGLKALDYANRKKIEILSDLYAVAEEVSISDCMNMGKLLSDAYKQGQVDEITLVYTNFVSMLSQEPEAVRLFPLDERSAKKHSKSALTIYEPSPYAVFEAIIPQFLSGMIYGGLCESLASEQGARRAAMESASKNASDMIGDLNLKYNRARQSAITQELTEIVSGAEAL